MEKYYTSSGSRSERYSCTHPDTRGKMKRPVRKPNEHAIQEFVSDFAIIFLVGMSFWPLNIRKT